MINKETEFFAVDNSGAQIVKVIASTKKAFKNVEVGDFVLVSIKSLRKKKKNIFKSEERESLCWFSCWPKQRKA